MSDNPFLEDQAIRAAVEGDLDELGRVLRQFLNGELSRLHNGAHQLATACEDEQDRRRKVAASEGAGTERGSGT